MLTRDDLKAIRGIVREEVGNESQSTKDGLRVEIKLVRIRIEQKISQLADRTKNLEIRLTKVHKDLKKEIKYVVNYLDKDIISAKKKIDRIEGHLGLSDN